MGAMQGGENCPALQKKQKSPVQESVVSILGGKKRSNRSSGRGTIKRGKKKKKWVKTTTRQKFFPLYDYPPWGGSPTQRMQEATKPCLDPVVGREPQRGKKTDKTRERPGFRRVKKERRTKMTWFQTLKTAHHRPQRTRKARAEHKTQIIGS